MTAGKAPSVEAEVIWQGDLRFLGRSGAAELVLDGDGRDGPTPPQSLALALAACMSVDIVDVLRKSRLPLEGLRGRLVGERARAEPRRFVKIDLRFVVSGNVPPDRVERAIALSREKYCSVWHSLRPDIDFTTSFEVVPAETPRT